MRAAPLAEQYAGPPSPSSLNRPERAASTNWWGALQGAVAKKLVLQIAVVFLAYLVAGKLGQATTNIRSSNLGPVWPAYGIALAGFLAYGYRVWPGIAASAVLVAYNSPVPALAAIGQATGATVAALTGATLLRRIPNFDPALSRLRDALGLIVVGALASPILSASVGLSSLYATGVQAYTGRASAWLIYWLGDGTGVLLVTPLVFTLPTLLDIRSRRHAIEFAVLLLLLTGACFLVFGDLPLVSIRLHVLAFAVLPFVMWAAIDFGMGGATVSVLLIATIATILTALGYGPFAGSSPFINAVLLDVLFGVLAVSGLVLAAVIAERERAETEHQQLLREQTALDARLRLTEIVESSNDAILSTDSQGLIRTWNAAAQRIFGFSAAEAIGQPCAMLIPPELRDQQKSVLGRLRAGERVEPFETIRMTKMGTRVSVAATISPLRDADGGLVGVSAILRDISEQKRAQEALSSLSGKLIQAQERERSRIARELHDDIGQRIALLAMNLTGLAEGTTTGARQARRQATELHKQAAEIAADVQALSHELHSSRIELLGITAAMNGFCREFAKQQKVTVEFEANDVPNEIPFDIALCLFRVLQEALHNSARHSGARQVKTQLWGAQNQIHLVVRDNGVGFDVERSKRGRGIGLASMEERIKLVNGDLSIESRPGRGATIHASVPYTSPEPPGIGIRLPSDMPSAERL